jgi:hypothetical protein
MTEQRIRDRGRGRFDEPPARRREDGPPRDPGAYIGRRPERVTATIPGPKPATDEKPREAGQNH